MRTRPRNRERQSQCPDTSTAVVAGRRAERGQRADMLPRSQGARPGRRCPAQRPGVRWAPLAWPLQHSCWLTWPLARPMHQCVGSAELAWPLHRSAGALGSKCEATARQEHWPLDRHCMLKTSGRGR